MTHTVIGMFDNIGEAQRAKSELLNSGFSDRNVDISAQYINEDRNRPDEKKDEGNSIANFFNSLFGEDDENAEYYTEAGRRSAIVTVHAMSREEAERAAYMLDQYGAIDVNERGRQYRGGESATRSSSESIPVIEENMEVGKREVNKGGVRLRSRIIERPVEEHLRLREEHINVERNPVNRPASEAELSNFKEGTYEATERKEVPVVNKKANVVEEVKLNKELEERDETISGTVRKTDVDVENIEEEEHHYDEPRRR